MMRAPLQASGPATARVDKAGGAASGIRDAQTYKSPPRSPRKSCAIPGQSCEQLVQYALGGDWDEDQGRALVEAALRSVERAAPDPARDASAFRNPGRWLIDLQQQGGLLGAGFLPPREPWRLTATTAYHLVTAASYA